MSLSAKIIIITRTNALSSNNINNNCRNRCVFRFARKFSYEFIFLKKIGTSFHIDDAAKLKDLSPYDFVRVLGILYKNLFPDRRFLCGSYFLSNSIKYNGAIPKKHWQTGKQIIVF